MVRKYPHKNHTSTNTDYLEVLKQSSGNAMHMLSTAMFNKFTLLRIVGIIDAAFIFETNLGQKRAKHVDGGDGGGRQLNLHLPSSDG